MAFDDNQGIDAPFWAQFIERLERIYLAMDNAYRHAAENYAFNCEGCRDNCCRSRFYHHTVIERVYLLQGLKTLALKKQSEVKLRARKVVVRTAGGGLGKETIRMMCPLNFDELCILYPYRPMICRLHGIPHELKKPGQGALFGPGCETFDQRWGHKSYFSFDRTPFYRQLAALEREVRQSLGHVGKIRMTVAEMLLEPAEGMVHSA